MKDSKYNKWYWDNQLEEMVPAEEYHGYRTKKDVHFIMPDLPDYVSPTTLYDDDKKDSTPDRYKGNHKVISGRTQRREDLRRNDCHEVDPGNLKHQMKWKDRNHRDPSDIIGKPTPYEINSSQADYRRSNVTRK